MPALDQLRGHKVVVIESYGSDSKPVLTCSLFVEREGHLFTRSPVNTQNVERIRARPGIRVAPSYTDSIPCGDWVEASASVRPECDTSWVRHAMWQKYGWSRVARRLSGWFKRGCKNREYAIIEIEPAPR
jgi:general stress protein 26